MNFDRVERRVERVGALLFDAAVAVHRELGAGLLERMYAEALMVEAADRGLAPQAEVPLPVVYKGRPLPGTLRADLVVGGCVVVEVKAVEHVLPVHLAQLQTYLRLTGHTLGFLLNFHAPRMVDGLYRRIWTPAAGGQKEAVVPSRPDTFPVPPVVPSSRRGEMMGPDRFR